MSYVNPNLREEFESLTINVKNKILSKGVHLNTLDDLNAALKDVGEHE